MKRQLIVILVIITAIAFVSCDKYCTCTVENSQKVESIEINPDENCSDYSEGNTSCY